MARIDSDLAKSYLWHRQQNPKCRAVKAWVHAQQDAAAGKKRYPHSADYKFGGTWQDGNTAKPYPSPQGVYFCDNWPTGWRELGTSHDVCRGEGSRRVDHEGWYTDDLRDNTLQGFVLQLPARNGVCQYVPGTFHSDWDGVTLYLGDVCDDKLDAASLADQYAERSAEESRDYDEAWRAGSDAADKINEVASIRRDLLAEFAKYRAALEDDVPPAARDLLRENMRDSAEESCDIIRELRADIDKLREGVPSRLMHAFNEGMN